MTFIACAAMLTSTVILTGCKKEGQNEPQSKAPEVTADITISLPANAVGGPRRMPGTTVQTNNGVSDFQGIEKILLVPFAKKDVIAAGDVRLGNNIDLGDINATTDLANTSKAKRYIGIQVPMGTSSFLFYGESKAKDATGDDLNFKKGVLEASRTANLASGISFSLDYIHDNASDITGSTAYPLLLAYVNSLLDAVDDATPTPKAWKNYVTGVDNEGFVELLNTYKTLGTLTSFGVQRMMNDLYENLQLTSSTLSTNLQSKITSSTYVNFDADATPKITLKSDLQNFPTSLNIPEGAVAIAYDDDDKIFKTSVSQNYSADFAVAAVTDYVYPSSLWYYANTKINTSTTSEEEALTSSTKSWEEVLAAYDKEDGSVSSTTRSIALKGKVNYGVARLDVIVKAFNSTLQDKVNTNITNATGYKLTGVLVGNQRNVGFDFTPENYAGENPEKIIFDKIMTNTIYATTENATANSTLVLASELQVEETKKDVYVVVELENNSGVDFVGANGVVPAGGKFYMVGKLESAKADVQETSETVNPGKRVFYPDYTTTARLTIRNLAKAYNTIPDLRTPSLELGLSVDLNWVSGKVYDIEL